MELPDKAEVKMRANRYMIKNSLNFPRASKEELIKRTKKDLVKSFMEAAK